mgnify:CR=1 FL=1
MLEVENLAVDYGKHVALHGVSLAMQEGETVVILGANGAGKSTLLKSIAGLVRPREGGTVEFSGTSIVGLPAHEVLERGIALFTFQMRLKRIPAADVRPGAHMQGEVLLHSSGADIDNMEAVAVHDGPDGQTRITLVSDNNFNDWERNLLLEFSLPE